MLNLKELNEESSFLIFVICDGENLLIVVRFEIFITSFICNCVSVSALAVIHIYSPTSVQTTKREAPKVLFRHDDFVDKAHMGHLLTLP